jgi:uncharacterized repeat protein (TIGR01451 family)
MFKKLLSNLAFNPSLIGQVSFYAKRLRREAAIRRAGVVLLALAMVLQMFAVFSPPQSSLQASPNTDLINGGFSSKAEAVRHCRNNSQDYKTIMNHFGISCDAISNAEVTTIAPRAHDGRLYSMGRQAFGVAGEQPVRVPGAGTFFVRHFWSLNHDPSYKALKVKDRVGQTHYILFGCGNLVSFGPPTAPPPVDECENIPGVQGSKEDCDVCPNKDGVQKDENNCDICPKKPGTQIRENCDVCPNKPGEQTSTRQCDVCPNRPGIQLKERQCDVCPDKPGDQSNENECKPCEDAQTDNDLTACLEFKKVASNLTQNISDANGTTAKPGDVIEYTLTTANTGKITIKDYQVNESIGDVLDYADVVDLHGGTKGEYGIVSWPKQDIKPGKSLTNKITVKIKSELPSTPASSTDPMHYDMMVTNVYGNTVNIKLPPSVSKQIEIATTTLPNTGPGTSLAIGFSLTVVVAYFFARSRLLAKELDIVRADFSSAGGF